VVERTVLNKLFTPLTKKTKKENSQFLRLREGGGDGYGFYRPQNQQNMLKLNESTVSAAHCIIQ
jgi:hypothetical protein